MLLSKEIIAAVAEQVEILGLTNLVVEPVMVSRTGDRPSDDDAVASLRDVSIPLAASVPQIVETGFFQAIKLKCWPIATKNPVSTPDEQRRSPML